MAISRMTKVISSAADLLTVAIPGPETNLGIIIGGATRGPAFVPVSFTNIEDFGVTYGAVDSTNFAKIAMNNWLTFANGSYLRLLGVGAGEKRIGTGENAGSVNRSGWVVGDRLVLTSSGFIGNNHRAYENGALGRTYFFGAFMSESEGSTVLSDPGIQSSPTAAPILRGVLMAASGVILSLSSKASALNKPIGQSSQGSFGLTKDAGLSFGDVNTGTGDNLDIVLLMNGHKETDDYKSALTASLDPTAMGSSTSVGYFADIFNTDPSLIQEAGHYLYTHYDLDPRFVEVTGTQVTKHVDDTEDSGDGAHKYQTAFLLTSSLSRNSGSATKPSVMGIPNFENFENRFSTPFSPYVTSQKLSGKIHNLFRVHALSDGKPDAYPQRTTTGHQGVPLKITIQNIHPSTQEDGYATFSLLVRHFYNSDYVDMSTDSISVLESYSNLDLNPKSDNFISKRIGDMHTYYNFDKNVRDQRLVKDGFYPNISNLIRVEVSPIVMESGLNKDAMPIGFRGIHHLITSGSGRAQPTGNLIPMLTGTAIPLPGSEGALTSYHGISNDIIARVTQPGLPFRENIVAYVLPGDASSAYESNALTWGVQFEQKIDSVVKNGTTAEPLVRSLVEYFPDYHTNYQNPWVGNNEDIQPIGGTILDADKFNRNSFTLEQIEVITKTDGSDYPDPDEWMAAIYRRTGRAEGSLLNTVKTSTKSSRFLSAKKDFFDSSDNPITPYLKFTFPLQGGFNGYNEFDESKLSFNDSAIARESLDGNQGGRYGPTISAYRRALDVIYDKIYDFKVLSTPGIRSPIVTNMCIETVEDRFDTFYVMDIQQLDENGNELFELTSTDEDRVDITNSCTSFIQRNIDSSFAAAYFPDLLMNDPSLGILNLRIPPSVSVMGVLARNDSSYGVGVRPVGSVKGAMASYATSAKTILDDEEVEKVFLNRINPIKSEGTSGLFIRSQQTTQVDESELSRIDIRRLIIEVRRIARRLARSLLFEMNDERTHMVYKVALQQELRGFITSGLLNAFKVSIPKPTASDIQANIIRGSVTIRPSALDQTLFIEINPDSP